MPTIDLTALKPIADVANQAKQEQEKLHKATRAFESYFASLLLKQMHGSAVKGGAIPENSQSQMYREMLDDEIGKQIGKAGGLGLGDILFESFTRRRESMK